MEIMKNRKKAVFREYDKYQLMLPGDFEYLIPDHHRKGIRKTYV